MTTNDKVHFTITFEIDASEAEAALAEAARHIEAIRADHEPPEFLTFRATQLRPVAADVREVNAAVSAEQLVAQLIALFGREGVSHLIMAIDRGERFAVTLPDGRTMRVAGSEPS